MTPSPNNRVRVALVALLVLAAGLTVALAWRRVRDWVPVVHVADLPDHPEARMGQEVVVVGEWEVSSPTANDDGLVVVLRGRGQSRVRCCFAIGELARRSELETRLVRAREVAIRGRWVSVEDNVPVLWGCRLLD